MAVFPEFQSLYSTVRGVGVQRVQVWNGGSASVSHRISRLCPAENLRTPSPGRIAIPDIQKNIPRNIPVDTPGHKPAPLSRFRLFPVLSNSHVWGASVAHRADEQAEVRSCPMNAKFSPRAL